MADLFGDIKDSIFGPDEAERININKVKQQADIQDALHQFNPALPSASDTAPKPESDLLSDVTFGLFGKDNSSLVKAHNQEVSQLAQAKDQGRMDYNQLLTRVSAITSKYSSMDPTNMSTYQAVGSKIIGFNPTEKLLSQADAAEQKKLDTQRALDSIYLQAGAKTGTVPIDPTTGALDEARLRIVGQEALAADEKFKQWQQDKKTAAPQAEWQAVADETAKARSVLQPVLANFLDTGRKNLELALMSHPEWTDVERQQAVSASLASAEQQYEMTLADFAAKNGMNHAAFRNLREENKDFWESIIKPLTGDLSAYKTMARTFDILDTRLGINMLTAAPHLAAAAKAFGPSAAGAMVGPLIDASDAGTGLKAGIVKDLANLATVNPMQTMRHAGELATGQRSIVQMTPQEQMSAVPVLLKGLQSQAENVKTLTPENVTNFGTGIAQLLSYSDQLTATQDLTNAAIQLNTPNMLGAIKKLESQSPQGAAIVGDKLRDLTTRAFLRSAASYSETTDRGVTSKIEYDPSTNKFYGAFFEGEKRLVPPGKEDKIITNLNQMAQGIIATKDYGKTRMSNLSGPEIGQALADVTGIQSKAGVAKTEYDPEDLSGLPIGITQAITPTKAIVTTGSLPEDEEQLSVKQRIFDVASLEEVPPALALGIASHETGGSFDEAAKSPVEPNGKYAYGVMQLREATATDLGVDRFDPDDNIKGGIAHLARDLKRYDGDIDKAIVSYYRGPNSDEVKTGEYSEETKKYLNSVKRRMKTFERKLNARKENG